MFRTALKKTKDVTGLITRSDQVTITRPTLIIHILQQVRN